tara:strand:- start:2013 stop:2531 length:519 start_codon:yes stop_codon:yes gene_type:complete
MVKKNAKKLLDLENDFYKKPRINSRSKGNTFERALAKKLNVRFDTEEFCRTPGSGAFGTTHKLPQYLKVHGDLITPEFFKFIIEAKRGYALQLEDLWKPNSNFYKFIEQASRDGKAGGRDWLLIYKRDRQKEIVISVVDFPLQPIIQVQGKYNVYLLEELLELPSSNFFHNT